MENRKIIGNQLWFSSEDERGRSVVSRVPVKLLHDRYVIDNPTCFHIIRGIEAGHWSFEEGMVSLVKELARRNKELLDMRVELHWRFLSQFEMPKPDAVVEGKPQ